MKPLAAYSAKMLITAFESISSNPMLTSQESADVYKNDDHKLIKRFVTLESYNADGKLRMRFTLNEIGPTERVRRIRLDEVSDIYEVNDLLYLESGDLQLVFKIEVGSP